jgi:hypothetical protein
MNCGKQGRVFFVMAFLNIIAYDSLFAQENVGNNTRRTGLFIGANNGNSRQGKLEFAQSDAETVSKIFSELGGIKQEDSNILLQPNPAMLDRRLTAIKSELAEAKKNGQRTEFIFYYAGHSDGDFLNLGFEPYSLDNLLDSIQIIEADIRIVILDMCYAGFAISRGRNNHFMSHEGCSVLTSTKENEESWEFPEIKSTFFTHSLVTGLRGAADANSDANITLKELYDFVDKEVKTKTNDQQNPQFNPKNTGSEVTVLANIKLARAKFIIGGDVTGRISIWDNTKKFFVSELTKEDKSVMELAFDFGDYQFRLFREENPSRWVKQRLRGNNNNISLKTTDFFPDSIATWWKRITSRGSEFTVNFYEPPPEYSSEFSAVSSNLATPHQAVPIDAALINAANKISSSIPNHAIVTIDISSNYINLSEYIKKELTVNLNNLGIFEFVISNKDDLDAINREIDRQMSGNVREDSQIPLGQNSGADTVITGSVIRNSENTYRLYINVINLKRGSLYLNSDSTYSVSVLNDNQMQTLTGNWNNIPIISPLASSVGLYFDLGGGYSWLYYTDSSYTIDSHDSFAINLTVRYFFTQIFGIGLYGTVSFPREYKVTQLGTSFSSDEQNAFEIDLLFGPIIMLYKHEKLYLPLSVGISFSYLRCVFLYKLLNFNREQEDFRIGIGTNITAEYHFLAHLYGYLRYQFDLGCYHWGAYYEKSELYGKPISSENPYSNNKLSLRNTIGIGIGYKL